MEGVEPSGLNICKQYYEKTKQGFHEHLQSGVFPSGT
jgi:hypothetical protein